MTQQEFKKAKGCISALKWQNFWLDLRTFMTFFAFISAGFCMLAVDFVNLGLISGEGVLEAYVGSFYLALMDWFGFFFMKIFGAFSFMSLSDFISSGVSNIITNVVFVLGAELAITSRNIYLCKECRSIANVEHNGDVTISCPNGCIEAVTAETISEAVDLWDMANEDENKNGIDYMKEYGYILAKKVIAIEEEEALDPVLNIMMQEVALDVDNGILTLAAREDVLNAVIVKNGEGHNMITEIGYMELGNKVGVFLCPGEFDPMLILGGPASGDASWGKGEWDLPALKDCTSCEYVMIYGLCNDQAGYVLRDNEYHSLLSENEEINVISKTAGSTFVSNFMDILATVDA